MQCNPKVGVYKHWWDIELHELNLLFIQYCFSILLIDYELDRRKLSFLNMQREHFIPIVQSLYMFAAFAELYRKYGIAVGPIVNVSGVWTILL